MATQPVRLVHASDLRLDRPLYGLTEAPSELRELLRDAPLEAAEGGPQRVRLLRHGPGFLQLAEVPPTVSYALCTKWAPSRWSTGSDTAYP